MLQIKYSLVCTKNLNLESNIQEEKEKTTQNLIICESFEKELNSLKKQYQD